MIWNILEASLAFFILLKGTKQYKRLSQFYNKLKQSPLTNVSQLTQFLKNKKPFERFFVILKGIAKSRSNQDQKNILSIIQIKDLRIKPAILNSLQKVQWSKILQNKYHCRPRNLKKVKFDLKDLLTQDKVQIGNCVKTNISGALTEVYSDKVLFPQTKNAILIILKDIYNIVCNMFPFRLFMKNLKYGQQIKYYGIMDGQYTLAIGQIYKNKEGFLQMTEPNYLTKQKAFIQKRIKSKLNYLYWIILVIGLIKVYVLYQLIKKLIKIYFKRKQNRLNNEQQQKRSEDEGDFANCIICYTNIRSIVLKPCRHYGFCSECYQSFKSKGCPLCKSQITGIIKVIKKK